MTRMVRKVNKRSKPPAVFKGKDKDRVLFVKCLKCGNTWFPNARRWGTVEKEDGKYLRCTKCQYRNYLSPPIVEFLMKQAKKIPETGFISIKEKKEYLKAKKKK